MDTQQIVDELQRAHDEHIKKLTELHESTLSSLHTQLQSSRQEAVELRHANSELGDQVDGMRAEVDELRESFEMVQGRLKRVLVDQDDLVKLLKLVNENGTESQGNAASPALKSRHLKDVESFLKSQDATDPTIASALLSLKYLKKLESSDPLHLSRLLEIPFSPERSFALSSSLLASVAAHISTDPVSVGLFDKQPVYSMLLNEIVRLRQEINELCRLHLSDSIKTDSFKGTISQCLIANNNNNNAVTRDNGIKMPAILASFLSTFK